MCVCSRLSPKTRVGKLKTERNVLNLRRKNLKREPHVKYTCCGYSCVYSQTTGLKLCVMVHTTFRRKQK